MKLLVGWENGSRGHLDRVGRNFLITHLISGRVGCISATRGNLREQLSTLTVGTKAWLEVSTIVVEGIQQILLVSLSLCARGTVNVLVDIYGLLAAPIPS